MKTIVPLLLTFLCLAVVAPKTRAVSPAPDGGYPGGNTAEGQNALFSLTGGGYNTALGYSSLKSNSTGNFNTAVGAGALFATNGDPTLNEASDNCAFGVLALFANTTGARSCAFGSGALAVNTTGLNNTAYGYQTMFNNSAGNNNTAVGWVALYNNTNGYGNAAYGYDALGANTAGGTNTAVGIAALNNNMVGNNNVAVGADAGGGVMTASNVICIGAEVPGEDISNACYVGNIFGSTSANGVGVVVNSGGRLGTSTSSRRFKEDIKPMNQASEALYSLKPVSFHYKKEIDPVGISQLGLVAEEVDKVNPDLVVRDKAGQPYSVRYDQVNAMLLNEFLKEHKKVQDLEANALRQQNQIQALTAGLQKVSAQLATATPSRVADLK